MTSSFNINKADLEFILKQIEISEATSIAYTPGVAPVSIKQAIMNAYGLSESDAALAPYGLRTVDGTYNNLQSEATKNFGAADTLFPRLTDPVYLNEGDETPFFGVTNTNYGVGGNVVDSDPRIISNLIADSTAGNQAAVEAALANSVATGAIAESAVGTAAGAIRTAYNLTVTTDNNLAAAKTIQEAAAFAAVAEAKAILAQTQVNDLVTALATDGNVDASDLAAVNSAVAAALTASRAAAAVVARLNFPGANVPTEVAAAQAVANNALSLHNDLVALRTALNADPTIDPSDNTAAANAALLAGNNVTGANTNATALDGAIAATLTAIGAATTAATDADTDLGALLTSYGISFDAGGNLGGNLIIPNRSPDVGLSPSFNSWMTIFGQFFDHGLDLVTKGNNGTVYVPLSADDPLIAGEDGVFGTADDLPEHLRFMALTRATPTIVNGTPQHENTTTSFIDQNQTYTSHSSHQVFLREYAKVDLGSGEVVVSTGKLLDGAVHGSIANWGEVKAQALTMLGIRLDDFDVHNVPLLVTDQYGKFIPGANGYAQMVMAPDANHATNWVQEGTAAGITTAGSIGTNHAFLNDIAHHAAPGYWDHDGDPTTARVRQTADNDGLLGDDHNPGTYDDEMLNSHFVTGDGRGNENIALTAVHSVFHSEHNRVLEANKATILASNDLAFLNQWLLVDVAAVPTDPGQIANLKWDGERLFQAARFSTEMQYQHLVFEEFARRLQPAVEPFVFNNSPDINPAIFAEFAHTVYRFGHSMLTGTVDRLDNNLSLLNGETSQQTLVAMFLNPQAYLASGATAEEINANLVRGLSRDTGSAIDEFIVSDLRSNLLGLPLDLAALNLSRGRETGIPSLNETRKQLYDATGLADLQPYTSWADFAANLKTASSVINFIAAYGTHATILAATTLAAKRAAAEALVFGDPLVDFNGDGSVDAADEEDRLNFINGQSSYGNNLGGLEFVDLWIGGLAEKAPEFGGMLGTTFNYVFEAQMELLEAGDRLYYLSRTQGTNLLNQLEPNTFSDLVMRNTELGGLYATHLNASLFITPDYVIELDRGIAQTDYNSDTVAGSNDPTWDNAVLGPKVVRKYATLDLPSSGHDEGGYIRFQGGEHIVLGGTEGHDTLLSAIGDDAVWGDGGNDSINAGDGADNVFGGLGDDIIKDPFGDDVLRGNQGNDFISSARGLDLLFGDQGNDYLVLGQDASEVFGGEGNDFILGGEGADALLGNEGDDWIEGGPGFDGISGDNSELFFNSPILGHDVLFGHGDETDFDAESGDDIMAAAGSTVVRYEGMFGFDWGIAKNDTATAFDLTPRPIATIPGNVLRDRFDLVEALSGWKNDDQLDGNDLGHVNGAAAPGAVTAAFADHILKAEGIDRIDGLRAWMGGALTTLFGPGATEFRDGNILMGGAGNDALQGRGGYDLIDGDAWLNVRIKIDINGIIYSAESMTTHKPFAGQFAGKVYAVGSNGQPDFTQPAAFGGKSLTTLLGDGTIKPGQLSIVREILYSTNADNETDIAIFRGNSAGYAIEGRVVDAAGVVTTAAADSNNDGFISVRDIANGLDGDDTDLVKNVEVLRFEDGDIQIHGRVTLSVNAVVNQASADLTTMLTSFNGTPIVPTNVQWYSSADGGLTATTLASATGVSNSLQRAVVGYDDIFSQPKSITSQWVQVGTSGADTLVGTAAVDLLIGLDGNDTYEITPNDVVLEGANGGIDVVRSNVSYTTGANIENLVLLGAAITGTGNDLNNSIGGNNVDNVLQGGVGNDVLRGYGGNDELVGDIGNDNLYGGIGADTLVGGAGNDIYYLSYVAADAFNDTITEINGEGTDTAYSVLDVNAPLAANVENLILLGSVAVYGTGNDSNNTIYGNSANNVLTGGLGNDILRDNAGNDSLAGGEGNDNLYAGSGADTLAGGLGNDVYYLSAVAGDGTNDTIEEAAGEGTDIAYAIFDATLADNVERLTLLGTAVSGTGNDINNTIYGNGVNNVLNGGLGHDILRDNIGDDTLNGGGGNDNLYAGVGADVLAGGLGDDVYYLSYVVADGANDTIEEDVSAGTDTAYATFSATLAANVERLTLLGTDTISGTGNELNNVISGNSANNTLDGGAGIDYLYGNGGSDSLYGGVGVTTDVLYGGDGADVLDGGDGSDYASYYNFGVAGQSLTVSLDAAESGSNTGHAVGDTFISIEYLQGSQFANNQLTGNSGNNNLYGYNGNDTLKGSGGNDGLAGGSGNDQFVFAGGAIGASNVFTLLGTDTITDFAVGADKIVLSQATFSSLTAGGSVTLATIANDTAATLAAAGLTSNQLIYSTGSGRLYYNSNGTAAGFDAGVGGNSAFAILGNFATQPALSATDIIVTA
jgi:Ca2+-binding RTX toxin-like protein